MRAGPARCGTSDGSRDTVLRGGTEPGPGWARLGQISTLYQVLAASDTTPVQPIASQHYGGLMGIKQYQPTLPANAGPDIRHLLIQLIKFCLLGFWATIYQQSGFLSIELLN